MSVAHPNKNRQKKARVRKTRKHRTFNPPVIRDDLPDRPPKPPRLSKRQRDALIFTAIARQTGLDRLYTAMSGSGAVYR